MNDNGKSDRPIVPKKDANKGRARACPAEHVEGRGLAKENSGGQLRFWTQGQTDLHHALERIREKRHNPRQEPGAVIPLAGICAGGRPQGRFLPRPFPFFFTVLPGALPYPRQYLGR